MKGGEAVAEDPKRVRIAKRLKKGKRRRILRILLIVMVSGAVLGVGGYWLSGTVRPVDLTIRNIAVRGNVTIDDQTVKDQAATAIGQNILTVNLNALSASVKDGLHARSVAIARAFPNTLVIDVKEMPILFAVNGGSQIYYVNNRWKVVMTSPYLSNTNVPLLSGLTLKGRYRVGEILPLAPRRRQDEAIAILKTLESGGMLTKISEVIYTSSNTYRIITKANLNIEVVSVGNLQKHMDYIQTLFSQKQSNMNVDLTTGPYPIVKNR